MQGGEGTYFALWIVGGEFDSIGLGDGGDFLHFENAATVDDVGLYIVDKVALADGGEAVLGEEPFAGGEWNASGGP